MPSNELPILYMVIPCYNEEDVLPITFPMFQEQMSKMIAAKQVSADSKIMFTVLFIGGVQILSLGVIGEYVDRTYLETKHRPHFIISDKTANL